MEHNVGGPCCALGLALLGRTAHSLCQAGPLHCTVVVVPHLKQALTPQ